MREFRLDSKLVEKILAYLNVPVRSPGLRNLNRLIRSYTRMVPWESVSRIVKRHATASTSDCPRWPEEFWKDAMEFGTGGTCFESSLAFFSLLTSLGFKGYLTVNDMGESRACHAAIVILLDGRKYLVDVTIPIYGAVRFEPGIVTRGRTDIRDHVIRPLGRGRYHVERSHHPDKVAFTLIDRSISLAQYRRIVEKDYGESGLFLKSVVMVKIMDDRIWRFFSDHKPHRLESFNRAGRNEFPLPPEAVPAELAKKFRMPEDKIAHAFSHLQGN
jgi:arylamine N-acetyltransferase